MMMMMMMINPDADRELRVSFPSQANKKQRMLLITIFYFMLTTVGAAGPEHDPLVARAGVGQGVWGNLLLPRRGRPLANPAGLSARPLASLFFFLKQRGGFIEVENLAVMAAV